MTTRILNTRQDGADTFHHAHTTPTDSLVLVRREASGIRVVQVSPDGRITSTSAYVPVEFVCLSGKWFARPTPKAECELRVNAVRLGQQPHPISAGDVLSVGDGRFVVFLTPNNGANTLSYQLNNIITASPIMLGALCDVAFAAQTRLPLLITGESGTGKELAARASHQLSTIASGPFVALNCAALPETLAEAELFGYCRGAFTGAVTARRGIFEQAHGGTLFLDEIGELSPFIQAKLLRVLETGEIRRLGSEETIRVNVRLVSATHRDLLTHNETGGFRSDLYYRISVLTAHLPALRQRPEDIRALCYPLLGRTNSTPRIDPAVFSTLKNYHWPGNVRELRNVLLRADARAGGGELKLEHLDSLATVGLSSRPHNDNLSAWRNRRIAVEFEKNHGHHKLTYQSLGISRSSFYRWLRTYRTSIDIPSCPSTQAPNATS